jgi:ATP-dependent Clp protease ATP-binding subunit ClpA
MFERFTDQARQVVVLAQEEARALGHGYIGTEHILLGLLSEGEGIAAQALAALDITLAAAREQAVEIIGEGTGQPAGHIPFTPRTKKVLELSLREAQRLGDGYIGTEHILLGLAREGEGVGAQVLDRLGASTDRVLAQVLMTARAAAGEEPRRVSVVVSPMGRRPPPVSGPAGPLRDVLARLDEIAGRLAAIENLLGEMRGPASGAARKPASSAGRKAPAAQRKPSGGAGRKPTAGGGEPAGQPEPPAAQV